MNQLERRELAVAIVLFLVTIPVGIWYFDRENLIWEAIGGTVLMGLVVYPLMALPIITGTLSRRRISGTRLTLNEEKLNQIGPNGEVIGFVSLSNPIECDELYREEGHAAYRIRQSGAFGIGRRVEFLSEDPLAEYLIRDVLGKEWPPPKPRAFYGH